MIDEDDDVFCDLSVVDIFVIGVDDKVDGANVENGKLDTGIGDLVVDNCKEDEYRPGEEDINADAFPVKDTGDEVGNIMDENLFVDLDGNNRCEELSVDEMIDSNVQRSVVSCPVS